MFLNSTKYMYFVLLFTVEFICMYLFDKNIFDVYAYLHFRFESFPLFSLAESETCQQSATVLHATSCGWRLPCQEAQIRQCESCVNSLHPAVCLPTALVITEKHTHTHTSAPVHPCWSHMETFNGFFTTTAVRLAGPLCFRIGD